MLILRIDEEQPAARPDVDIDAHVWERLEVWCKHRWGERTVTWTVEGPGEFVPNLKPATYMSGQRWNGTAWEEIDPADGPVGKALSEGVWKLTYTVGDSAASSDVVEAARRFSDYLEATKGEGGIVSLRDGDFSVTRATNAVARALIYSGAADMLRAYR